MNTKNEKQPQGKKTRAERLGIARRVGEHLNEERDRHADGWAEDMAETERLFDQYFPPDPPTEAERVAEERLQTLLVKVQQQGVIHPEDVETVKNIVGELVRSQER